MAIRREAVAYTPKADELALIINNGDRVAMKGTADRLGFKDEESLIRFALAVLAQSATRSVTIVNQSNERVSLNPSADLLTQTPATPAV